MAEGMGLISNLLHPQPLFSRILDSAARLAHESARNEPKRRQVDASHEHLVACSGSVRVRVLPCSQREMMGLVVHADCHHADEP